MSDTDLAFGERHHHCDPTLGGAPLCPLGQMTGTYAPKWIQISGAGADEVRRARRSTQDFASRYGIFVIGEAPGRDEDLCGMPFVGQSGQLLIELLEAAEFPLLDTFITNTTRCRPPKNRKPGAKEIRACLTHLYFEARKFQPRVLVPLGASALSAFGLNREGGITHVRGKVFERKLPLWPDGLSFQVIPTYHPAYLLYMQDPKLKAQVIADLTLARRVYEGTATQSPIYQIQYETCLTVPQVEAAAAAVRAHGKVGFDTESPDLRFRTSPMTTLQLSIGKSRTWVIPFMRHDPSAEAGWKLRPQWTGQERHIVCKTLKDVLQDPRLVLYGQNAKYDLNVLRAWLEGCQVRGLVHDVACLHHLLHEAPPHDLGYLGDVELHVGDWEMHVRNIVGHGRKSRKSYDHIPDEVLWPYGATDAEVVYRLGELYVSEVAKHPHLARLYLDETQRAIGIFQESEWTGVGISRENLKRLDDYYAQATLDIEDRCREIAGADFNPGSPEHVYRFLSSKGFAEKLKAPTATKGFTTAKDVLHGIDHPICEQVLAYRHHQKLRSTYVENLVADIQHDGRVRYGMRIHGTVTGRQACSMLHQIPRADEEKDLTAGAALRSVFIEDEGYQIVYGDFSQVEFVIMAFECGDPEFIRQIEAGESMHKITAATVLRITPAKVDDFNKNLGKRINFGIVYGSHGEALASVEYRNPKTGRVELVGRERAEELVETFHRLHPRVRQFQQDVLDTALVTGCTVRSRFGRERRLPELNTSDPFRRSYATREAINFKIQSPAASLTTRTMIEIDNILRSYKVNSDRVRLLFPVHDAILYGVRDDLVDWFKECFRIVAERPIPEYQGRSFRINIGSGRTWAEAEKNSK